MAERSFANYPESEAFPKGVLPVWLGENHDEWLECKTPDVDRVGKLMLEDIKTWRQMFDEKFIDSTTVANFLDSRRDFIRYPAEKLYAAVLYHDIGKVDQSKYYLTEVGSLPAWVERVSQINSQLR